MGIATDSYRVNKSDIPPGLVACAMVDVFYLCRKWSLNFSWEIILSGRLHIESKTYREAKGTNLNADGVIIL